MAKAKSAGELAKELEKLDSQRETLHANLTKAFLEERVSRLGEIAELAHDLFCCIGKCPWSSEDWAGEHHQSWLHRTESLLKDAYRMLTPKKLLTILKELQKVDAAYKDCNVFGCSGVVHEWLGQGRWK